MQPVRSEDIEDQACIRRRPFASLNLPRKIARTSHHRRPPLRGVRSPADAAIMVQPRVGVRQSRMSKSERAPAFPGPASARRRQAGTPRRIRRPGPRPRAVNRRPSMRRRILRPRTQGRAPAPTTQAPHRPRRAQAGDPTSRISRRLPGQGGRRAAGAGRAMHPPGRGAMESRLGEGTAVRAIPFRYRHLSGPALAAGCDRRHKC
jgi:hypothetical protein